MVELDWDISCRKRHRLAPQAENYPSHTITVVVAFPQQPAGRLALSPLPDKIGQPVVIENRTGPLRHSLVSRALRPDGYTLHANSLGDAQNIHYIPLPYRQVDDFAMISWIVDGPPLILAIDAKLPIKTVAELIADAEVRQAVHFGSPGVISEHDADAIQSRRRDPCRRCPTAVQARRQPHSRQPNTRAPSRSSRRARRWWTPASSVPARDRGPPAHGGLAGRSDLAGAGLQDDTRGFVGLGAPARTPKPIVAYLNKHLNEVLQTDTFRKPMAELGMHRRRPPITRPRSSTSSCATRSRAGALAELTGQKLAPPKQ